MNRIRKKLYPDAQFDITYTYDEAFSTNSKGRLTTVNDVSGTATYYYDKLGRTTKTIKTISGVNYTTQATYDALSRTDTITYPDSTVIKYEYDTGGNLLRVKNNATGTIYASYTGYNALGQIGRTDFGNGVNTIYQYLTQNNRLYSITTSNQTTGLMNVAYNYDNIGNIKGITDYLDTTKSRTYVYDDLNRLTSAASASYGGTLTWQYDKIGNMTYNSRVGNYTYGAKPHAVTQAGTDTYTYDANGNMYTGAGRTFTYDYDNRPTSIANSNNNTATISVYDASGQRVKKVVPLNTTTYIGQIYECNSNTGTCTKYIFAGSQRIAQIKGADTYYYHTDHLGSSSIITDSSGNKAEDIYYYPYGEIKTNTGSIDVRYKFTGQEYDAETGLIYFGARYYDPKLARFTSADTIVPEPFDPQTLNRYAYAYNNPIMIRDLDGHCGEISMGGGMSINIFTGTTSFGGSAPMAPQAGPVGYSSGGSSGGGYYASQVTVPKMQMQPASQPSFFNSSMSFTFQGDSYSFGAIGGGGYGLSLGGAGGGLNWYGGGGGEIGSNTRLNVNTTLTVNPYWAQAFGKDVIYDAIGYSEKWSGGSRSWRNNNPGNIRDGKFADAHGAIGHAGGFAVFPNLQTGLDALTGLLQTSTYSALTVGEAVSRYAPASENNTANYQRSVSNATGINTNTPMSSLTTPQINSLAGTIQQIEGYQPGTITRY